MSQQLETPIVFIIFNRPEYTARVFAAIAQMRPSRLLVIADGPRSSHREDHERCMAARSITEAVDWPCQVSRLYRDSNLGLLEGVSGGISWAFSQVERAVILEDDCLPDRSFFGYCETLLDRYETDERVAMISGTNPLDHVDIAESYYFSRFYSIWGWATWKRAWNRYRSELIDWKETKRRSQLGTLYTSRELVRHVTGNFDRASSGRLDSWDIFWFYACLFGDSLCAIPRASLVTNIGAVGTNTIGEMKNQSIGRAVSAIDSNQLTHPQEVIANSRFDHALGMKIRVTPLQRLYQKLAILWYQRKAQAQP